MMQKLLPNDGNHVWARVPLGELGSVQDGDWILNSDYSPAGVRLLQVGDVGLGRFIGKSERFISHGRAQDLKCTLLKPGDLLISRMPDPIGRACILPDLGYPAITAVDVSIWRPDPERIIPEFAVFYLSSAEWLTKATALATGATRSRISRGNLERLPFPVPPINEQKRIAAQLRGQLAEVERARAAVAEQLQAAEALPAAILRTVFSSPAAQHWPRVKLEDIAILQRGRFSPRPRNDPRFYGGPHPFVQTGAAETQDGFIREWQQTLNDEGLAVSKKFPAGTLVISIAANIGGLGILTFDSCMPDSLVGITGREGKADNRFLYFALRLARPALKSLAPQMAQANLSLNLLAPFEIKVPSLPEQRALAARLQAEFEQAQSLREHLSQKLAAVETLPSALLREAFSGQD